MLYATEIACQAAELEPTGSPLKGDAGRCCMCSRPIKHGSLVTPLSKCVSASFANYDKMRGSGGMVCGFCARVAPQNVLRAFQRSVVTPQGVYSISSDEHRSWFWSDPPPGPFVVVINSNMTAKVHYLWWTPVTLDNRFLTVNFDGVVVHVRRGAIDNALRQFKVMQDAALRRGLNLAGTLRKRRDVGPTVVVGQGGEGGAPGEFNSPFLVLKRDSFSDPSVGYHGKLSPWAIELARTDPTCKHAAAVLCSLMPGELCALASILKSKPVLAVKPPLVSGAALFEQVKTPSDPANGENASEQTAIA